MANTVYVGPDETYTSIQSAVDYFITEEGDTPFTAEHNIIITNGAAYDGYSVHTIVPTLTYRLNIVAATSSRPIILAKSGDAALLAPVQLASPYVKIQGQELRGGPYGLVATSEAIGTCLRQVMVRDPWRVGLLFDGTGNVLIHNCVVYAPNTCVVAKDATSFTIVASTMKNGMNSLKRESILVPANIPDPYPSASVLYIDKLQSDTETINLRGNNFVAVNGPVIATNTKAAAYFESDYNNYYSPQHQVAHFLPLYGKKAMTLAQWRTATSQDSNSIAEDPRFYQGEVHADLEDGLYQDLKLRPASLLRAKAPELDDDSWPAHITSADLTGDFLDVERTTPNFTMGAYELSGSVLNYWDRIFPIAGDDPHGDTAGILEAASAHYGSVVKPWYPKMRTGFFWVRDHLYYLYSDKTSATLDKMRWFEFDVTGEVISDTATATFDGDALTSVEWNVRGSKAILKAADLLVTGDSQTFSISGEQLIWDTGELDYSTGEYTWSDTIANATRYFVLDPAPVDGAPIVLTDSSIAADYDTGELPFGFAVSYNDDLDVVVMELQSGDLPESAFSGYKAGDPYALNDIIDTFTWAGFTTYGEYLAHFPGLDTWGQYTRDLDYEELSGMTVEWETSKTGIYEITDLSMNPIHNPKTEGFLCIPNVAARQWDRTLVSGEATLEDNWLAARTGEELPWARVSGKNKWAPLIREFSAPRPFIAAFSHPTGECAAIASVPGPLVALQGTTGEEVLFTFMDSENNPVAFEFANFSLSTTTGSGDTGEFPGYLAKRQFGLYTNLGQSLNDIETDAGGYIALRYIPPDNNSVVLFNPSGVVSGDYQWFETVYDTYPDNYGNPTIIDQWGSFVTTTGELVTGEYSGSLSSSLYEYTLARYPVRSSVVVYDDTIRQQEVYHQSLQDGQFYVDYESKTIKSKSDGPLTINFVPTLIWRDPDYPRRLMYHSDLSLPTYYVVSYDAWIRLTATLGGVSQVHDIVCRNPYDTGEA